MSRPPKLQSFSLPGPSGEPSGSTPDFDADWRNQTEREISRLAFRQERISKLEQRTLRQLAKLGMPLGVYVDLPSPSPTNSTSVLLLRGGDASIP